MPSTHCTECGEKLAGELRQVGATTHILCGTDDQRQETVAKLWHPERLPKPAGEQGELF